MAGYYEGYSYVGFLPNGVKQRFATEQEYWDEYFEQLLSNENPYDIFVGDVPHRYEVCKEG